MAELKRKKIVEQEEEGIMSMHEADLLDPNPDIHALFCHFNQLYFGNALGACTVDWSSKRMTLCAGICQYMKMGGCAIRLSEPLLKFRSTTDLKNTLLHEMIHAYLWLTDGNKDHNDHGPCFQKVMMEINSSTLPDHQKPACGYAVSIYHNFTDEVDNYRTHHWKCQTCGDLIKRAMNRQPSASDCMTRVVRDELCNDTRCHWHQHQKTCCGEYIKIAEPEGYQDKRRRIKITGKWDHDGKMQDETILKKLNKGRLVTDHIKEEDVTGTSSHRTPSLESFYPKLEKKVNLSLDENHVLGQKESEKYDELLIFKRREQNPDEKVKAVPNLTLAPKVDETKYCNPQERVKVGPSSTQTHEVENRRKFNPEERGKAGPCSTLTPEIKQRGKCNPEKRVKAVPCLTLTSEAENKLCNKVEGRCQKSECAVGSGTSGNDFDVIIKWKGWYAFERDDDEEGVEPLINKRQERRRQEKMLVCVEIQNNGGTQVSVEASGWEKSSDNADNSIFQAGRNDITESHTQRSLIKRGNARLDTNSRTGMVGSGPCLICASRNFECSHLCPACSSQTSLPSLDSNRPEAYLKRGRSYFQHTSAEEISFEPSIQKKIPSSSMELDTSCDSIAATKSSYFGSTGNVGEKAITSNVVGKKEMPHEDIHLDLKGRVIHNLIQLDDTDLDAVSPKVQSIMHEISPSKWHFYSKSSGTLKGDTVSLETMNSCFKICDSESEEDCPENSDLGDEVGIKRAKKLPYLNGQPKIEENESRQRQVGKIGNDGCRVLLPKFLMNPYWTSKKLIVSSHL
ncbi:hypothetical protein KI387_009528, partial [Taxus chinensis]